MGGFETETLFFFEDDDDDDDKPDDEDGVKADEDNDVKPDDDDAKLDDVNEDNDKDDVTEVRIVFFALSAQEVIDEDDDDDDEGSDVEISNVESWDDERRRVEDTEGRSEEGIDRDDTD